MTGDTKYSGSMSNESKIAGSITGDIKFGDTTFLATQALDFLMTQDDNYLVIEISNEMTNEIKL